MGSHTARRLLPLLLLAALLLFAQGASAHADLVRAEPEPNQRVDEPPAVFTFTFSEPIEPAYAEIRVLDPDDQDRVQSISISDSRTRIEAAVGELEEGLYTVRINVVSAVDGHPSKPVYLVGVRTDIPDDAVPDTEQVADIRIGDTIARALAYAGASLLAGIPGYLLYRFRFVPLKGWLHETPLDKVTRDKTLILIAAGGGLLSAAAVIALLIGLATRIDTGLLSAATTATSGRILALRAALLLVGAGLAYQSSRAKRRLPWTVAALIFALGALLVTSLGAHAASTGSGARGVNISVDFLHQVAAAAWVSGVLALLVTLPGVRNERTAGILVRDFSPFALGAVLVLVLTGVYGGLLHFENPAGRALTGWEWMLIAKILLLLPLVALGAWNRYRLQPRLLSGDETPGLLQIKRSVKAEVLLMALVLLATGALTHATPPRGIDDQEGPLPGLVREYLTEDGDLFQVGVQPHPPTVGITNVTIRMDPQDELPDNFRLFLTLHDPDGGETGPFAMERFGEETQWYLRDTLFTQPGDWHGQVLAQGRGYYEVFDFTVEVE